MSAAETSFRLAPMSRSIFGLTVFLWALPLVFFAGAALGMRVLVIPAILFVAIYAWVWLRFRPSRFIVRRDAICVIWPAKRREIPRAEMSAVRIVDRHELRRDCGWCLRVGAGGLWGGFGWLWTERRGVGENYILWTRWRGWVRRAGGRAGVLRAGQPQGIR